MQPSQPTTISVEPDILYFGTPVTLLSTSNEDGTANLSPTSSAWWLGWRCVLGLDASSKTTENLLRSGEIVINLPSPSEVDAIDRLARYTGTDPVPAHKQKRGYAYEKRKFELAGLTPVASETVQPPRALECPVQLEAVLSAEHDLMQDGEGWRGGLKLIEVRIQRVHVHPSIMMEGKPNHIDPDLWKPVIMSFQK
ncbi:MAG: flavin reductase family protein, partial [Verrucomicrobiaceae bacterium]